MTEGDIRIGATLEGADEGVLWYIRPDFSMLTDAKVWADAASQVFYSLGISCGSLVTLASYSKFDNNCHRCVIILKRIRIVCKNSE
jgi:solute carrier family 6 amino acid transporter-like protein 5/7/9/14